MTKTENARPFFTAISKKLNEEINAKMKRVKAHTLVQKSTSDTLLAAWFLSPEELKPDAQTKLKNVLGVDILSLPQNPFFEPDRLETEFAYRPFPYFPKEDLFSFGYPELALGIGLLYGQTPTDLVGQPDRSYFGVRITTNFRKSFMTGANAKGIGMMVGADGTFGIASRFGEDYKRTRAPNPIYFENEEEEVGIVPLYEGQVFGALGFRLRQFALFGGLAPRYDGAVIGFYRTHGAAIPYFGRLELRFVERFPIVIEGRYGNLLDATNNSQGGTIEIPISEGFWIQGGFFQTTLPAQFFGLDQRDKVRIDAATLSTGHLGMWYGF